MTELPKGWARVRLDEVATISGGIQKQPSRAPREHTAPFLRVANVGSGNLDLREVHQIEIGVDELERYRLAAGDLLVVEGNGSPSQIGRAARWRGEISPCVHQNHLIRVRPGTAIGARYLEYLWMSPSVREEVRARAASTSGLYVLTTKKVGAVELPLAPSGEQERIVAAVEETLSKLDAGEAGLRTVRQLLKRMRDAILAAAVTGRLVPQDPADTPAPKLLAGLGLEALDSPALGQLPGSWAWVSMGDVTVIGGGIQKQPKRAPAHNPTPFLRVANVGRGTLDLDDVHLIEVFDGELDRYGLERGDLLVVEGNGSPDQIGRSAMWHGDIDPCVHQNHLIRVRPSEALLPEFLELYWNSPAASRRVQSVASSTSGLHTLSTGKLKVLPVAIPPLEEQARIVSEVDRQVSFLDACEQGIDGGVACAAALRRSVLKAAFEGQLVPQDPSDQPASMLLQRIRAERAAAPKAARRSRRTA